ncbi:hypothetical protein BRC19_00350 [Candidatus Saccharibacteria bacterium QS_5_54_17]|nr:MAG: hypothetical protein BRC19_00350 [Candidatus Saccharibacteria bacterium QS_5_54_17]
MQTVIVIAILLLIAGAAVTGGYLLYRRGLRYAKGIERGIKMVPILINLPPPSEDVEVGGRDVREVIHERISQAEVLYNLIASTATKGFKSKFFGQRHIAFELIAVDGVIQFYAAVPVAMVEVVKQAVLTAYPGASMEEVEDHNIFSQTGKIGGTYGGELVLKQDYPYPIATFDQLKRNTMEGVLNALTSLEDGDGAGIQILLRPARSEWTQNAENMAKEKREDKDDSSGFAIKDILKAPLKAPENNDEEQGSSKPKQASSLDQAAADAIEEKAKYTGYEVLIRIITSSSTASRAQVIGNNIVASFSMFDAQGLNGFTFKPAKNMERFVTDFIFRFFPPERRKMILNSTELSTIFHFPDAQFTQTSQVQRQYSKQVEGPSRLSQEGLLVGHNVYRGVKKQIRLSDEDRRRHVYIVGQTGTGKSVLLENMMTQDMRAGKGIAFIDPHGDAAEKLLGMVPQERSEDVIYFDPGNMEYPPGLNLFEYYSEDQKDFLIQEAINMLEKLYDPHQQGIVGPRYHHMFRNAALTVMADPHGGTFIDISKLFRDSQFVKEKLQYVEDKTVLEFWQKEMPQAQKSSDFGEMVSWFVSKFGAFLSNQMMRNIIGQSESSFDLRDVMDNRKILIANLSKGRLGELNSMLLGMIFVMKFQAAAMSRANQAEEDRVDFSFYIDEFQNFSTESFAFILSEARKYHLNMIVANQFISQLSEEVREAVFGNVGTIISLRTGPNDADFLVKQFSPTFNDRDLVNLPNFHAAVRLMNQGLPTQPFNMTTIPPLEESSPELAKALKQLSNAKYGRPRQEVEDEIFGRLSTDPAPDPYQSLANSQGGESAAAPAAARQSGGAAGRAAAGSGDGGSTFLDEWLQKRRSALGGGPGQPAPGGGGGQSPGRQSAGGQSAGGQDGAPSQAVPGSAGGQSAGGQGNAPNQAAPAQAGQGSGSAPGNPAQGQSPAQAPPTPAQQPNAAPGGNQPPPPGAPANNQPGASGSSAADGQSAPPSTAYPRHEGSATPQQLQPQQQQQQQQQEADSRQQTVDREQGTGSREQAQQQQQEVSSKQQAEQQQPQQAQQPQPQPQPQQAQQQAQQQPQPQQPQPQQPQQQSPPPQQQPAANAAPGSGPPQTSQAVSGVYQIPGQPAAPAASAANPAQAQPGADQGQPRDSVRPSPSGEENVIQPPDDTDKQSARDELMSALEAEQTDTWVGNQGVDSRQQTADREQGTGSREQAGQPQAVQPSQPSQTTHGDTSDQPAPGNTAQPETTQPDSPAEVDPGDTITPEPTAGSPAASDQPAASQQEGTETPPAASPATPVDQDVSAAPSTEPSGGEDRPASTAAEPDSEADSQDDAPADAGAADVSQQVASDLGVELPPEQQTDQTSGQTSPEPDQPATPAAVDDNTPDNDTPDDDSTEDNAPAQPGQVYIDEDGNVHQG